MRRDMSKVRGLLMLVEKHASENGISRGDLDIRWPEDYKQSLPLEAKELVYLTDRCVEAGLLTINQGTIQLTWSGHDWLDKNRDVRL